jgi:hypothetical protein
MVRGERIFLRDVVKVGFSLRIGESPARVDQPPHQCGQFGTTTKE